MSNHFKRNCLCSIFTYIDIYDESPSDKSNYINAFNLSTTAETTQFITGNELTE